MNRHQRTQNVVLFVWVLALSAFGINAQTQPAGEQAPTPQNVGAKVRFTSGNSALKIPVEIDNNIILMQVRINGSKPLRLIFDTGASHTVISSQRTAELGLKTEGHASGTATGGPVEGSFIRGVSLSVQGAEVTNQLVGSFQIPTVPGFEFDGVIGYGFINQFVVEIDYLKKIMNLYEPGTYAYGGKEKAIPLLFNGGRIPFVQTKIVLDGRDPIEARLEVDTGADGTFLVDSPFVTKQRLLSEMSKLTPDRGIGAGGESKRVLGHVKAVELGQFVMSQPPLALSLDSYGARSSEDGDGLIGGEIFRRFKVILDYRHKQMFLEPNESFKDPYRLELEGNRTSCS